MQNTWLERESVLRFALQQTHDCQLERVVDVVDVSVSNDVRAWEGKVYLVDISGHRNARQCFLWAEQINASTTVYHAVLHRGRINSAEQAVRSRLRRRSANRREGLNYEA